MARGWRDHFVPQLLIRRFTNEQGRVFCFDKKTRRVPDRIHGNKPRDVLHKPKYYLDQLGDLDAEFYKPIEDEFGPHLSALLEDVHQALSRPGLTSVLNAWVASQASRTQFAERLLEVYGLRFGREDMLDDLRNRRGLLRDLRMDLFECALHRLDRSQWRFYRADKDERREFVLSDEAVVETPPAWATGRMFIVPLSPTAMVAAGDDRGHAALRDPERNILPLGLNGVAMSYAYRFVYSRRLLELDTLASIFEITGGSDHDAWVRHAAHAHFGMDLMLDEADESDLRQHFSEAAVEQFLRRRQQARESMPPSG